MKIAFFIFMAFILCHACNSPDSVLPPEEQSQANIKPRTVNTVVLLDGLSGVSNYNSQTNEYLITNLGNIEFQPWGSSNWYAYSGKNYKVKCNCGSSDTGGCEPRIIMSDPVEYFCNNSSCTVTCELDVTVTDTQANGGGVIAHYPGGGTFRADN